MPYLHPFKDKFTPVSHVHGYLVTSKVNEFFAISGVSFRRKSFVQEECLRYRESSAPGGLLMEFPFLTLIYISY